MGEAGEAKIVVIPLEDDEDATGRSVYILSFKKNILRLKKTI